MADDRVILHSDMNSFYASVEMMLDPRLKGKAVAVCGATEERHGIVLAKSELAKRAGVKTGMVNWEARQRCPELILVPPQYDQYLKYSKLAHEIYYRYGGLDLSSTTDITAFVLVFPPEDEDDKYMILPALWVAKRMLLALPLTIPIFLSLSAGAMPYPRLTLLGIASCSTEVSITFWPWII